MKYGSRWVHLPNEARALFYKETVDLSLRAFLPGLRRLFAKHVHEEFIVAGEGELGGGLAFGDVDDVELQLNTPAVDEMGFRMNFLQFFTLLTVESSLLRPPTAMLTPLAARQIFNEAKMEAIIGVPSAKTDRLSFGDFLDALCRIAYYLAPFQPVENVLLLLFDHVFFQGQPRARNVDKRFFHLQQEHMLRNVRMRMAAVRDSTFFSKREEPLQSIYHCHTTYTKELKRAHLDRKRALRRQVSGNAGILLFAGITAGRGAF